MIQVCRRGVRMLHRVARMLVALAMVTGAAGAGADEYPRQPGIDVLHYGFRLELIDDADRIEGLATVELRALRDGVAEVTLDLVDPETAGRGRGMSVADVRVLRGSSVSGAEAGVAEAGERVEFRHAGGRLQIPLPRPTVAGERWRIAVRYGGVPATGLVIGDTMHGERSFFSDNWPNKARHWLPTVDHPYDKATSEMAVTAPDHYQVVSNGLLVEETDLADDRRLTRWRQAVPIATWLYVLGVARFAVEHRGTWHGGDFHRVPLQTWVYPQDRETGFEVFAAPTAAVLDFYDDRVGPYAYEKLANVQSNSVGGGMEAATAIFYGDESATGARPVRWRNVVIHEIAHQWWGNAVTEADWDDVWLSEGFATYFTLLFREHAYGRDDFLAGLVDSRERVLAFDDEHPDYRIVHDDLDDMSRVTTGQTYQKGAWVLHMLRGIVGDREFWHGIRSYYARYENGNATTADFRREMEEASGTELGWFFEQWLERGGYPVVEARWRTVGGVAELELRQVQEGSPFRLPLTVAARTADGREWRQSLVLDRDPETVRVPVEADVANVVLDPDTWVLMRSEVRRR